MVVDSELEVEMVFILVLELEMVFTWLVEKV